MITLKAGGARTRVEIVEAQEIAVRFKEQLDKADDDTAPVTLDLSGRSWPRPSLEALETLLTSLVNRIFVLQLDDIIASLPTEQGLDSLSFFSHVFGSSPVLEQVFLNDNALGSRGDEVLLPLFSLSTVHSLELENCGMSAEVAASFLTSLSGKPIQKLRLGRNQMGSVGARNVQTLLQQLPGDSLQVFWYNGCRPLQEGTSSLLRGLASMAQPMATTALRELNLHDCSVSNEVEDGADTSSLQDLVSVLAKSPHLTLLNLQDNTQLGSGGGDDDDDNGLSQVLQAVKDSGARLQTLSLGGCELGSEGAATLAKFILANEDNENNSWENLTSLFLDTNELGNEGIATLLPAMVKAMPSLQTLDFECNDLEREAVMLLVQQKIPSLKTLKLTDNMDIPARWGAKLSKVYHTVLLDEDLEDDDNDDNGNEEDEEVNAIADQLADLVKI